jgi:hypothetical protein
MSIVTNVDDLDKTLFLTSLTSFFGLFNDPKIETQLLDLKPTLKASLIVYFDVGLVSIA